MSEQASNRIEPRTISEGLRWWWLRPPRRHGEVWRDREVSFLELFYDLVYVVLIAQVAHTLAEHVSWSGLLDFAVVFALIWIAWFNGTYYHELHAREDGRSRTYIFIHMMILALLAVYAGHATEEDGQAFAIVYTVLLVVLTVQWFTVFRVDDERFRPIARRYVIGMAMSAGAMLVSAFLDSGARNVVWMAFAAVWIVLNVANVLIADDEVFGMNITLSLVERYGLFTIIVLGEVVVGVVEGLSESERTALVVLTGLLALNIGFGFWWNYFDVMGRRPPTGRPSGLMAWSLGHLPLTLAIAAGGAAMVSVIEHAADSRTPTGSAWLLGGMVAAMSLVLAVLVNTLDESEHVPDLHRPTTIGLVGAAVATLVVTALRPPPWLFLLLLGLFQIGAWQVSFNRRVRLGVPFRPLHESLHEPLHE